MNVMQPYSVLILEDEAPTREYFSKIITAHPDLTLFGAAANCAEARQILRQGEPDILVADIGLPDGCGIHVIREACERNSELEAMVITGFGDEKNVVQALEAGATGYLLKQQAFDELPHALLALMRKETVISPKIARFLLKRFNTGKKKVTTETQTTAKQNSVLTLREYDVLNHISKGFSYDEMGEALNLSTNTIRSHIRNIYRKLAVNSRSEAVFKATQQGLITLDKPSS